MFLLFGINKLTVLIPMMISSSRCTMLTILSRPANFRPNCTINHNQSIIQHQHVLSQSTNKYPQIIPSCHMQFSTTPGSFSASSTSSTSSQYTFNDYMHHGISLLLFGTFGYLLAQTYLYITDFPEPCSVILQLVQSNTELQHILGNPITTNGLYSGNVSDNKATISLPIKGDKNTGVLHAKLYRADINDIWRIVYLQYSLNDKSQRYSISTDQYNQHADQPQATEVTGIDMSQLPDSVKDKMKEQIELYRQHMANKQRQQHDSTNTSSNK